MGRNSNTKCKICGKDFYKRPSGKLQSNNHYCSIECRSKDRPKKNKNRMCETCGQVFRYTHKTQRFCSLKCVAKRARIEKWNGKGKNKSKTLMTFFKKDGWDQKCMIENCNYNITFDIHRIIEGSNGGVYDLNNTVAICPNHHAEIHRLKKKIKKLNKFNYILEGFS